MAVLDQLNLNLGTEQNANWVLHDLHDKRISTTAVTTATHLLATNAGVTAMNPISAANLASVLGTSSDLIDSQEKLDSAQSGVHYLWGQFIPDGLNVSLSGIMLVFAAKPGLTINWKINIIIDTNAQTVYMRFSVDNGSTWRSWFVYNGTAVS